MNRDGMIPKSLFSIQSQGGSVHPNLGSGGNDNALANKLKLNADKMEVLLVG